MRLILILLIPSILFSVNLERIPLKSNNYYISDYNFINNGEAPLFYSRPYSVSEVNQRELPNNYFKPILALSLRIQSLSRDIEENEQGYWYNKWIENDPLLSLGFITGNNYFLIHTEFDIRHDFFGGFNNSTYINIPYKDYWYQDFDFNFPVRGYIITGTRNLQLFAGRDKLDFGPGQKGALIISGKNAFYNQLTLSYISPKFKGTYFFIPLESYLTDEEKESLDNFFNSGSLLIPSGNFGKDITEQSKFLTGHRFEFKPFRNLMFSFTDMLIVGGRFANFEDIPPSMFYHNIYGENYSNVLIGFDLFWVPINGLGLYGEFIIDDIRNNFEDKFSVPTSMGYLGGVRYNIPNTKGRCTLSFEVIKVDPYTYLRWHPYTSFYTRRKLISTSIDKNMYVDTPIGFYLGPDSLLLTNWVRYNYDKIDISLGWEYRSYPEDIDTRPQQLIESYSQDLDRVYIQKYLLHTSGIYNISNSLSVGISNHLFLNDNLLNVFSIFFTKKL